MESHTLMVNWCTPSYRLRFLRPFLDLYYSLDADPMNASRLIEHVARFVFGQVNRSVQGYESDPGPGAHESRPMYASDTYDSDNGVLG